MMFVPKSLMLIGLSASLLATAFAAIPLDAGQIPQVHDGLSPPAKAWGAAMEAGDLAALVRMHNATTIAYPPNKLQEKGAATIAEDYADLFAKYTVRVATDDTHWIEQGPLVVSWGLTILTLHPKAGGADVVKRARFTDAAVKTVDGWRYVVDHASEPTAK